MNIVSPRPLSVMASGVQPHVEALSGAEVCISFLTQVTFDAHGCRPMVVDDVPLIEMLESLTQAILALRAGQIVVEVAGFYGDYFIRLRRDGAMVTMVEDASGASLVVPLEDLWNAVGDWVHRSVPDLESAFPGLLDNPHYRHIRSVLMGMIDR